MARKITQAERNIPQKRRKLTPQEIAANTALLGRTEKPGEMPTEKPEFAEAQRKKTLAIYGTENPTQADILRRTEQGRQGELEGQIPQTISEEKRLQIEAELARQERPAGREEGRAMPTLQETYNKLKAENPNLTHEDVVRMTQEFVAQRGEVPFEPSAADRITQGIGAIPMVGFAGLSAGIVSLKSPLNLLGLTYIVKEFASGSKEDDYLSSLTKSSELVMEGLKTNAIDIYEAENLLNKTRAKVITERGKINLKTKWSPFLWGEGGMNLMLKAENALTDLDMKLQQIININAQNIEARRAQMVREQQF